MDAVSGEQSTRGVRHQSMSLTIKLLRLGGMWPESGDGSLYKAYTCLVSTNCVLFMMLLSHIYFGDGKDASAVIENTDHILTVASYVVTMLSILANKGRYEQILRSMQSMISYGESDHEDERKMAVREGISTERKLCRYYVTAISTTASCFLLKPLVTAFLTRQDDDFSLAIMGMPLKLAPFTDKDSVLKVAFEYTSQCAILSLLIVTIVPLDLFTFMLIKYLATQFQVLGISLGRLGYYGDQPGGAMPPEWRVPGFLQRTWEVDVRQCYITQEQHANICLANVSCACRKQVGHDKCMDQRKDQHDLKDLVKCHQEILKNAKISVDLLSPIIFSHYLVSSVTICLVGYQITTAENKGTMISNCAHLSSFLLRLFVLCYLSSEVYYQSLCVSHATYSCSWYSLRTDSKMAMLLLMLRAQRPVCLRASQFGAVSLQTFSVLVQTAYSYYSVLIKMNS